MNQRVTQALTRLAAQKPMVNDHPTQTMSEWKSSDITSANGVKADTSGPRFGRRSALIASGLTVAALGGSVFMTDMLRPKRGLSGLPLLGFHPPASSTNARGLLLDLSRLAMRQPPVSGSGEIFYSCRRTWNFVTSINISNGDLGTENEEKIAEAWIRTDGTGRYLTRPVNIRPELTSPAKDVSVNEKTDTPLTMPVTHQDLVNWFRTEGRQLNASQWLERLLTWTVLLHSARTTSALLEVLADIPGFSVTGTTIDRAGRPAIAVSTTKQTLGGWFPRQRTHLLCDPSTGKLLAIETTAETADEAALGMSVTVPMSIHYLMWIDSSRVIDTSSRP